MFNDKAAVVAISGGGGASAVICAGGTAVAKLGRIPFLLRIFGSVASGVGVTAIAALAFSGIIYACVKYGWS